MLHAAWKGKRRRRTQWPRENTNAVEHPRHVSYENEPFRVCLFYHTQWNHRNGDMNYPIHLPAHWEGVSC